MTTDGSNTFTSIQGAVKEGPEAWPQDLTACHTFIKQLLGQHQQIAAQCQELLDARA